MLNSECYRLSFGDLSLDQVFYPLFAHRNDMGFILNQARQVDKPRIWLREAPDLNMGAIVS